MGLSDDMLTWFTKAVKYQVESGRLFLHEHPESASSWKIPEMQQLMEMEGVIEVVADQCMIGVDDVDG